MRSAIIAAIVGVVAAVPLTETIYNTEVLTITSCGPEVTDCPGKKTPVPAPTTSCTEGHKESHPAVYWSTSAIPVVSTTSVPAPPPYVKSSEAPKPSSSEAAWTSSAPAPPPYKETSKAVPSTTAVVPPPYKETSMAAPSSTQAVPPPPPPYKETSSAAAPSSKVTSKPAVGTSVKPTGTASTGVVPYKTSGVWSATSSGPAMYTGAASHLNAAGALVGAGAIAALFL